MSSGRIRELEAQVATLMARVAQLEGMLCRAHEDCREHPVLAAACSMSSPPQPGDVVVWIKGMIVGVVERVDDDGRILTRWHRHSSRGYLHAKDDDLIVVKRSKVTG